MHVQFSNSQKISSDSGLVFLDLRHSLHAVLLLLSDFGQLFYQTLFFLFQHGPFLFQVHLVAFTLLMVTLRLILQELVSIVRLYEAMDAEALLIALGILTHHGSLLLF